MVRRRSRMPVVADTNVFVRPFKARSNTNPNRRIIRLWLLEKRLQNELHCAYAHTQVPRWVAPTCRLVQPCRRADLVQVRGTLLTSAYRASGPMGPFPGVASLGCFLLSPQSGRS